MKRRRRGGFSLVELMTVVSVIGVMAAIAVPQMRKQTCKSAQREATQMLAEGKRFMDTCNQQAQGVQSQTAVACWDDLGENVPGLVPGRSKYYSYSLTYHPVNGVAATYTLTATNNLTALPGSFGTGDTWMVTESSRPTNSADTCSYSASGSSTSTTGGSTSTSSSTTSSTSGSTTSTTGGGGGGCFVAGTPITMADGTTRAIEDVQVGDEVLAFDVNRGLAVPAAVEKTFVRQDTREDLVSVNGRMWATANHPVYVEGDWKRADQLKVGDVMMVMDAQEAVSMLGHSASGSPPGLPAHPVVVHELVEAPGGVTVFNFMVANHHNYFAGGILVHNASQIPTQQE